MYLPYEPVVQIILDSCIVLTDLGYTFLRTEPLGPDEEEPKWITALVYISVAISSLFILEIPFSLYAFSFRYYNPFGTTPHAGFHLGVSTCSVPLARSAISNAVAIRML